MGSAEKGPSSLTRTVAQAQGRAMYKIIGGDGKEYGPASAEEVRGWIRAGRANGQTLAQAQGQTEWRPLSELPDFAEAVATPASTPLPPLVAGGSSSFEAEVLAREVSLSVGSCLSRGWALVRNRFWLTVGSVTVAFILQMVVEVVPVAGWIAGTLLAMVLWGGVDWLYLKALRQEPATFGDTFSGFSRAFVPLLILSVITMTLVPMGLLLCVLPGVYLMAIWMLFPALLIMDKKMDFWPAMELSRKMVNKHFWPVIWLMLATFVISFAGLLLLLVGVFITLAIGTAAIVAAYEDLFGARPTLNSEQPIAARTGP
jgi:hypothetical protein